MQSSAFTHTLKTWIYGLPAPPKRTRTKPLRVICVGPPRSATESLSIALTKLGYTTLHGWDLQFDNPAYLQQWVELARKKWCQPNATITAEEFDERLGHADAIVDTIGYAFAREMIEAYPDAKVVLNTRRDRDAWQRSIEKTFLDESYRSPFIRLLCAFQSELFWMWEFTFGYCIPGFFRTGNLETGIVNCGQWVYKEHEAMIRGLVPRDRLLEWTVEDGWDPLCYFLDHPVPLEAFPRINSADEFVKRSETIMKPRALRSMLNMSGFFITASAFIYALVKTYVL
ncbi:hypothetical protein DL96DRAFT_1571915 [Flagelloscypha sp. PMI_526]|nr:hypothetical protein DL96DRAFT_1571915 [Flagelloscypha sp. PMI_526]